MADVSIKSSEKNGSQRQELLRIEAGTGSLPSTKGASSRETSDNAQAA